MQPHACVGRRAGAAHAAQAVVPDQNFGPQTKAGAAPRTPGLWPDWEGDGAQSSRAGDGPERDESPAPRAEAVGVSEAREFGDAVVLGQLGKGRLATELLPHVGKVLHQLGRRHAPAAHRAEARGHDRRVPRPEAGNHRIPAEGAVTAIERAADQTADAEARDAAQIAQQCALGSVAVREVDDFRRRSAHAPLSRADRAKRALRSLLARYRWPACIIGPPGSGGTSVFPLVVGEKSASQNVSTSLRVSPLCPRLLLAWA